MHCHFTLYKSELNYYYYAYYFHCCLGLVTLGDLLKFSFAILLCNYLPTSVVVFYVSYGVNYLQSVYAKALVSIFHQCREDVRKAFSLEYCECIFCGKFLKEHMYSSCIISLPHIPLCLVVFCFARCLLLSYSFPS